MVMISPGERVGARHCSKIGEEDFAVHRGVDDERSGHAVLAQAGDKGGHFPVAVWDLGDEPFSARAASAQPGHVG
jgi:hypothetical protein